MRCEFRNSESLILIIAGLLLFLPGLGQTHLFDWDEINFAESAREMLITGNWWQVSIDFHPFWEKPPLFIALQALSMSLFGVNEMAARLPNAITGVLTLVVLYRIGLSIYDKRFALLFPLIYTATFAPHLYFKSGIIDPLFNLLIYSGIYSLFRVNIAEPDKRSRYVLLAGLLIGVAVLTKGPVALLITMLTTMMLLLVRRKSIHFSRREIFLFLAMLVLASSPWYIFVTIKNGLWYPLEFIRYQIHLAGSADTGHAQPFYYHFIVLLLACFPFSALLFARFRKQSSSGLQRVIQFRWWNWALLGIVLLIFSIVKTKIIHYSSLAWLPIVFLISEYVYLNIRNEASVKAPRAVLFLYLFLLFLWVGGVFLFLYLVRHPEIIIPYVKDPFVLKILETEVSWPLILALPALILLMNGIVFYRYWTRGQLAGGLPFLLIASIIFIQSTLYTFVPRIEKYTQGAAIEFYRKIASEEKYVEVLGFKSYAHLFYARKKEEDNSSPLLLKYIERIRAEKSLPAKWPGAREFNSVYRQWLLEGDIDRTAYFVAKVPSYKRWKDTYGLEEIGQKGGFVFLKRSPSR